MASKPCSTRKTQAGWDAGRCKQAAGRGSGRCFPPAGGKPPTLRTKVRTLGNSADGRVLPAGHLKQAGA